MIKIYNIQSIKSWCLAIPLLVFSFLILACGTDKKHDGYTITGKISGAEDGIVKIVQTNLRGEPQKTIDSTQMLKGIFKFKGKVETPDLYTINLGERNNINLYLENSNIQVDADFTGERDFFSSMINTTITGSSLQDSFEAYQKQLDSIRNSQEYVELNRLNKIYNDAAREGKEELSKKLYEELEKLEDLGAKMQDDIKELQMQFVKKNGSLPVAANIMEINFVIGSLTYDEMTKMISLFKGDAKQTRAYNVIKQQYTKLKKTQIGEKAPSFTLKTDEGVVLSSNAISNKYMLLDFWASWCKPCRAAIPHLKENYKKYKSEGFEVLAISIDENHEEWQKAIVEDQTNWLHVIDLPADGKEGSSTAELYGVSFIPATYLLDEKGKIIAKNLKEGELDKKLEELFGY